MSVADEQTNVNVSKTCVRFPWGQVLSPAEPIKGETELEWLELALSGKSTAALWISLLAPAEN